MKDKLRFKGLYFVHSIYQEIESSEDNNYFINHNNSNNNDHLILFKEKLDDLDDFASYYISRNQLNDKNIIDENNVLIEGKYVLYKDNRFYNADNHPVVAMNNDYIRYLISNIENNVFFNHPIMPSGHISDVRSYHINVGHGNCSIIVFRNDFQWQMWMIDSSAVDFINHKNYYCNIKKCLNDIKLQYNIKHISKLLITHLHFDHYNAIEKLVTDSYINSNTEVWMNIYYPCKSRKFSSTLRALINANVRFIIPTKEISNDYINIFYPQTNFDETHYPPKKKINNSSVVYQIILNGKRILFTGDLETEGWDEISDCAPYLKETNYYCISHHGSLNGHIRSGCKYMNIDEMTLADCNNSKIQILMGRNHAYNGIYSPRVLNDFKRIKKTEDAQHYIMIDWSNDDVEYF